MVQGAAWRDWSRPSLRGLGDGALAFSTCTNTGPENQELDRVRKEGAFFGCTQLKGISIGLRQAHAAAGDHAQARILELGDDLAGEVRASRPD